MKVDIELQQTDVGGFQPVHARFVRAWSPYGTEDDSDGDDTGTTEVVEASDVWRRMTRTEDKLPSGRPQWRTPLHASPASPGGVVKLPF